MKRSAVRKRLRKAFQHYGLVMLKNPGVLFRQPRYIFLLGHMRSFSTLLAHILGSHPQISGYSEMWLRYRSGIDLTKLRLRVASSLDYRLEGSFVLDKILHNQLAVRPELLARTDVFSIFLTRQPEATIRSIMHLWSMRKGSADNRTEDAVDYYTQRLERLENYYRISRNRLWVEGEVLINEPEKTLSEITGFLGLSSPLLPEYSSFEFTGRPSYGDSSEHIRSGVIVKVRDAHAAVPLPENLKDHCLQAYSRFTSTVSAQSWGGN